MLPNSTKRYSYKNGLQDVSWCFKDSLPRNFLTILPLLLPVSWMVTKYTFIGITLEDTIAINIPMRNWYINYDNRTYHCTAWRKIICNICIFPIRNWYIYCVILEDTIYYIRGKDNLQRLYLKETDTYIGMWMFPTVHHREFLCVQRNPHYYPGITQGFFYQFLYTNQYFLNTTLFLSHTPHTYCWGFHFHLWTFASETWSLTI